MDTRKMSSFLDVVFLHKRSAVADWLRYWHETTACKNDACTFMHSVWCSPSLPRHTQFILASRFKWRQQVESFVTNQV